VFDAGQAADIPTKVLITALRADEERPWAIYSMGEPITDRQLAKLLKPFGIVSITVHPPDAPHAFDGHLHACTLTNAHPGRENSLGPWAQTQYHSSIA
jgi:hypothetical protein